MRPTFNDSPSVLRVCENRYVELRATADGSLLRTATYQDREHIVVPIITAVGDEVWWPANAPTPELVPASVLQAAAQSRNNRPVVMGHPKVSGTYVSANSPEILEQYCFGHMFASEFVDGRIKVEAWLDPVMAEKVGPAAVNVIDRLKNGEKIEVSEGNYVVTVNETGLFKGKEYKAKWVSAESDHLATLDVNQTGACSNKMGCGNLVASVLNAQAVTTPQTSATQVPSSSSAAPNAVTSLRLSALSQARRPTFTGTETGAWSKPSFADYVKYLDNSDTSPTSVAQCSTELKAKIAAHTLLGDPAATTFSALSSLPVVNPATDKLNERALRAILAGRGTSGIDDKALLSAQEIARRLLNSEFSANLSTNEDAKMKNKTGNLLFRVLASIKSAVSNNDLRWNLYKALSDARPGVAFVDDEDLTTKIVRYCVIISYGDYWDDETEYHYFTRSFETDDNANIILGDDETEVQYQETWKPVDAANSDAVIVAACGCEDVTACGCDNHETETNEGDQTMSVTAAQKKLAGRIIAASKSPFEESDRPALESMKETRLEALVKVYEGDATTTTTTTTTNTPAELVVAPVEAPTATPATPTTPTTPVAPVVVSAAPGQRVLTEDEFRSLKSAADAYEAQQVHRRTNLITGLKTAQSAFTEADLTAMETSSLEKLAVAFKVDQPATVDYSMRGFPTPTVSKANDRPLPDTWGLNAKSN